MITLPDGTTVRVQHYRITPALAGMLVGRKDRLKDLLGDEGEGISALAQTRWELKRAGIPLGQASNMGGITIAEVIEKDGDKEKVLARGEAICRADESFNKRIGRDVAIGRALRQLRDNKPSLVH